jgi:polyisoprenoid-binding protein YceI
VGALRPSAGGATADADLTIRGKTKRIAFPFRFTTNGTGATLDARVTLDRLDYGLGTGEWADDSVIGHKVDVLVHLVLKPAAN